MYAKWPHLVRCQVGITEPPRRNTFPNPLVFGKCRVGVRHARKTSNVSRHTDRPRRSTGRPRKIRISRRLTAAVSVEEESKRPFEATLGEEDGVEGDQIRPRDLVLYRCAIDGAGHHQTCLPLDLHYIHRM